jgi:hypothetical protein
MQHSSAYGQRAAPPTPRLQDLPAAAVSLSDVPLCRPAPLDRAPPSGDRRGCSTPTRENGAANQGETWKPEAKTRPDGSNL